MQLVIKEVCLDITIKAIELLNNSFWSGSYDAINHSGVPIHFQDDTAIGYNGMSAIQKILAEYDITYFDYLDNIQDLLMNKIVTCCKEYAQQELPFDPRILLQIDNLEGREIALEIMSNIKDSLKRELN